MSTCSIASTALAQGESSAQTPDDDYSVSDIYQLFESNYKVATASKIPVRVDFAPSIVTVIPKTTLQARGYRSLAEALTAIPGLFVINDLVTQNIGVRGTMSGIDSWSRIIKFMVNGVPVTYDASGGALTGLEFLPIAVIQSIEVIRGPGSALYGANAYLGVVNVITEDSGRPLSSISLGGEVGAIHGQLETGEEVLGRISTVSATPSSVVIAVTRQQEDRSGLRPKSSTGPLLEKSVNDTSSPTSIFLRADWHTLNLGHLSLQVNYQRIEAMEEFGPVGLLTHDTLIAQNNLVGRLEHRLSLFNDMVLLHSFLGGAYDADLPSQLLDTNQAAEYFLRYRHNKSITAGTEAIVQVAPRVGGQSALLGVEYAADRNFGDTVWSVTRPNAVGQQTQELSNIGTYLDTANWGVYGELNASIVEFLFLTGGVRYDISTRWTNSLSWRAGAAAPLGETTTVRILYGTSFVPPAPTELRSFPLRLSSGVLGNPTLQPQTAGTLEIALRQAVAGIVDMQLNGYWSRANGRVEFEQDNSSLIAQNLTTASTLGVEASVEARWSYFLAQANASYSYTDVDPLDPEPPWLAFIYGDSRADTSLQPSFPAWMGHATVGAKLPKYFGEISATVHLIGRRASSVANTAFSPNPPYTLPGYVTVDANLHSVDLALGDQASLDLSLHATNLFNHVYFEPGSLGADIPTLGRSIFLRARVGFNT